MCEAIQAGHAQIENTQVGADDDTFQFQQRQRPLSKANIRLSEMRMGNSSDLEKENGSCPSDSSTRRFARQTCTHTNLIQQHGRR
jgi:hypothetical protein